MPGQLVTSSRPENKSYENKLGGKQMLPNQLELQRKL